MVEAMTSKVLLGFPLAMLMFAGCVASAGGPLSEVDECGFEPVAGERGERVEGAGTVRWQEIEGGFWSIVADDGARFEPINLCEDFQKEGERVSFEGWKRTDMASFRMWGTVLELESVRSG